MTEILLFKYHIEFKEKIKLDEKRKPDKKFMSMIDKITKYNLGHYYHICEDIFQEIA